MVSSTCGSIGCAHGIASFQSSGVLALEPMLRTRTVTRVRPPADTTGGENSRITSNFGLRTRTTIAADDHQQQGEAGDDEHLVAAGDVADRERRQPEDERDDSPRREAGGALAEERLALSPAPDGHGAIRRVRRLPAARASKPRCAR